MASLVLIYVRQGTKRLGPFSEEEVVRRYRRGEFAETDLAMVEGMTGWHPLATYLVDEEGSGNETEFDASAPPQLARETRSIPPSPPPQRDTVSEPEEMPSDTESGPQIPAWRALPILQPIPLAWTLLGLGVVFMILSKWPWTLWLPLIAAAIVMSVLQIAKNNFLQALPLLCVALLLPWFVYSQWLAQTVRAEPVEPQPAAQSVPAPMATPAPVAPSVTTEPKPQATAAAPAPVAAPEGMPTPDATPEPAAGSLPSPSMPKAGAAPKPAAYLPPSTAAASNAAPGGPAKGDRVVLSQDVPLLFGKKQFRVGRAGEEFDVLAAQDGRVYLSTKNAKGDTIAVSAPVQTVQPVGAIRPLPRAPEPMGM